MSRSFLITFSVFSSLSVRLSLLLSRHYALLHPPVPRRVLMSSRDLPWAALFYSSLASPLCSSCEGARSASATGHSHANGFLLVPPSLQGKIWTFRTQPLPSSTRIRTRSRAGARALSAQRRRTFTRSLPARNHPPCRSPRHRVYSAPARLNQARYSKRASGRRHPSSRTRSPRPRRVST